MNDAYYIAVTIIFGLFVIFIVWWLYKWLKKPTKIILNPDDDLSDETMEKIGQYCSLLKAKMIKEQRLKKQKQKQKNKSK